MKRRIFIGLGIMSVVLVALVTYTIQGVEHATSRLEDLVKLHRVEIIRERLLITLKRTQGDLFLKNTRYARAVDTVVDHVQELDASTNGCFDCHHEPPVHLRLVELKGHVTKYEDALSRVLTMRANQARLEQEEDAAYQIGTSLIQEVDNITTLANARLGQRTREVWAEIARTKLLLFLMLAAIPLLVIVVAAVSIRGIAKPIEVLVAATRKLKGGDLGYRISGLRDEYGEVADSFNDMAGALQQHWQKMQWAEQIVVLGELAGGLAHEINNPLAGIKGSMQALVRDPALPPQYREVTTEIVHQLDRIEALVQNLLDFARPPRPRVLPVDLNGLLAETIHLAERHPLYERRADHAVELVSHYSESLPKIEADPMQLQQVFLNLLLNAADAIKASGTVTVSTRHLASASTVQVMVEDTGVGLDGTVRSKLFLPFYTTKAKGTGLGLATSRRLIEQHGGQISCDNRPAGGAVFCVELPLVPDAQRRALS